jgi:crossover junction endodeoxyribonuclease RusA
VTDPTAAQPWTVTLAWTPDQNSGRVSTLDRRVPLFAIARAVRAGDALDEIADDYDLTVQQVWVIVQLVSEVDLTDEPRCSCPPMDVTPQEIEAARGGLGLVMFVPGRPAPQGSKRHVGNGILLESSRAVAPWRTTVAWHAADAFRGAPLDGPIVARFEFVMPRPTSLPKRKPTPPHTKRPDVDKLARAVMDALSGVVWRDDSQVTDMHPTKRYAELDEQPGVNIRVRTA